MIPKKINIITEDDFKFKSPEDVRKSQVDKILGCYSNEVDLHKSSDEDREEYSGPDKGPNDKGKNLFDNKNITEESNEYLHHKLMAGYHSVKVDELNNESLKLSSSNSPEVHQSVGDKKKEAKRHSETATAHREKARSLHNEKEHGKWEDSLPTKAQAVRYGSKNATDLDEKTNKDYLKDKGKTEKSEDGKDKKGQITDAAGNVIDESEVADSVKKGDISWKLSLSSDGMVFSKKGKEFKALAAIKLAQLQERIMNYTERITQLKSCLEKEHEIKFHLRPSDKGEQWSPIYQWISNPNDEQKKVQGKVDEYSGLSYKVEDLKNDSKVLEIIIANVEDSKAYNVNISQLTALEKGEKDELRKSEGGRGGKIIGHTKSGKPIYMHANHTSHKDFTAGEHHEAEKLHESLKGQYEKEHQSVNDAKMHKHHNDQESLHFYEVMKKKREDSNIKKSEAFKVLGVEL